MYFQMYNEEKDVENLEDSKQTYQLLNVRVTSKQRHICEESALSFSAEL